MDKVLLTLIGIIFLTVLTDAQDFGRLQRMMLMRRREMAMRRGGFPFVINGPIRGPTIGSPPFGPLFASTPFGSPFGPSFFGGGSTFETGSPFSSGPFTLPGTTGISGLDLSTLGLGMGPGETLTLAGNDGLSTFGGSPGIPPFGDMSGLSIVGGTSGIGGPFGIPPTGGSNEITTIDGPGGITSIGTSFGDTNLGGPGGIPNIGGPSGGIPNIGGPSGGMPNIGGPSGGIPNIGGPSGGIPNIGGPSGGFPNIGGPSGGFPNIGGPSGGIPNIGGPSGGSTNIGGPSGGSSGFPSGLSPSGGSPGSLSGGVGSETGGNGNIFGPPPTQELNRGTVEPSPQFDNSDRRRQPTRQGFRSVDIRQSNQRQNRPMGRFQVQSENPRDLPPRPLALIQPEGMPPLSLVAPNDPRAQVRSPVPLPGQPAFVPINQPMVFALPPPGRPRYPLRRPSRRLDSQRRRSQRRRTTRVFPNVPTIPQIPAAPNTQGPLNDGQQQGNTGVGQDGNRMMNPQTFRFNGQPGLPANGDPRMGQQSVFPVTGMNTGFPTGPMGPTGGAIFPSQSAQGRITRQPAPGFSESSSMPFTGAPNGQRQQQGPDGALTFDRNNQFAFQGGRPGGFPGMPGAPFGQPQFVGPVPGQRFPGRQVGGMGQGRPMFGPTFGFVRPNTASAGPAFSTNTQSSQNFNLQFQPLPGNPNVGSMPEMRPDQNQMGLDGQNVPSMNGGFSSNGMSQTNTQFVGGMGQTNMQTGTDQGSAFSVGSNQNTEGTIRFGTGSQETSSLTVSDRTVEENSLGNNNNEFRIVAVGDVVNNDGLVDPQAADGPSGGMNMDTITFTETKPADSQSTGDISTAFESFGNGASMANIIDLSATDLTNNANAASAEANSVTSSSSSSSVSSSSSDMSGSPFPNSINPDFSFFVTENSPAPNDMPPIDVPSTSIADTIAETSGFMDSASSPTDFLETLRSLTMGKNDVSEKKSTVSSEQSSGPLEAVYVEPLTISGDDIKLVFEGPSGAETITFPVTGNEPTPTVGDQGFSSSMTSSTSTSTSSSGGNSMGDMTMGDITLGDMTPPATDNRAPPAGEGLL